MRAAPLRRFASAMLAGSAVLLGLLVAGSAGALWWTLPARDGTLSLPGLSAPVDVAFDANGIPRITAATELDAAMAMGVLHARDRLFQMEAMRRGGSGRLAEIAGPTALRLDRFTRLLGLARRAEADLAALPTETRALLNAYAAGVNAWIGARGRFAAPEFLLLGAPEPWTPRDSLLWGKVMGLYLSGNWRTELERARLVGVLPPERLRELWPDDGSDGRAEVAAMPGLDGLLAALPRFPDDAPLPESASNAWAVSSARSVSGGAMLASDPHLGFQAPVLWYLARVELPGGRFLAGATAPGVPSMVIGRSDRLAWGFTTTHSDTQDVFVERLVGADSYETPEGPRAFATREELIAVRGQPPEVLRVRETRHGPVISDLEPTADGAILAVQMANLAPGDTAAAGLHALNRARGLEEARAAAEQITSPSQNLMVADAEGRVAMFLTGRTPVRASGDGSLPAPGWNGARDWTGWVAFDALPHVVDPASGAVANANNRVQPRESGGGPPPFLGRDWFGDWRFRRVGELLAGRTRHAPGDFVAMQNDVVSLLARDLLPVIRRIPRPEGSPGVARDLLSGWDGSMDADRPQPLILNAWVREVGRAALRAGGVPSGTWDPSPEFVWFVLNPDGRGAHWCGAAGCDALISAALERAVVALSARFGGEPGSWRWGAAHFARFEHPLLRFVPVLGWLTGIDVTTPGDGETISRGGWREGFAHVQGAGLRLVADLGTPDGVWAAIGTGQSGNPLSRHWDDMNGLWAAGRAVTLARDATAGETLRLKPREARYSAR